MAQVTGPAELRSKPGVTPAALERFLLDKMLNAPYQPGTYARFLRCDRGDHDGAYALFLEIESVE